MDQRGRENEDEGRERPTDNAEAAEEKGGEGREWREDEKGGDVHVT